MTTLRNPPMWTRVGWQPINYRGVIHYDPRDELRARAEAACDDGTGCVMVPRALALACAELRECGARTVLHADEDGPLPTPQEIQCRKPEGHEHDHYNGYCHWPAVPGEGR